MLGWRSSGLRPEPSGGGDGERVERVRGEHEQPAEERAEAEQHGGRVRRDLAQAPARQERARGSTTATAASSHSSSEPSCEDHTAAAW